MNKECWTGPNGIDYEFIFQGGLIDVYFKMENGNWLHSAFCFKSQKELEDWKMFMIEKYSKSGTTTFGEIHGDPYKGNNGYVGD